MKPTPCFCGCGERAVQEHHVVYAQELVRLGGWGLLDARNLVPVALLCHGRHHSRQAPYVLSRLPDSVFEFAAEVMGAGRAYNYLGRRYAGEDRRLDALLEEVAA